MFERLFGKKEEKEKGEKANKAGASSKSTKASAPVSDKEPAPPAPAQPPLAARAPLAARGPLLRVPEESAAAEERARAAIAAIGQAAAAASPAPVHIELPEDAGTREQAAAYFSSGEHKRAIDLLVGHLNKTSGNAPRAIWFMLMDAYQSLGQQAAFEKSAWMFADFFKTSPPSWQDAGHVANAPVRTMGRNVLVLDGLPSRAHPEKVKDFIAAARQERLAKLDLSRTRLDEDHVQRSEDLVVISEIMKKLRRHGVETLLMGENQLVEVLRAVIQNDLPVPRPDLYWLLLLEFMQWRGNEDAYEDLAIEFAKRFGRSAPGYEPHGAIAQAPTEIALQEKEDQDSLDPPAVLDDATMSAWLSRLAQAPPEPPLRLEFGKVRHVSFSAAGALAAALHGRSVSGPELVVVNPSEIVHALFDITGVSGLVSVEPRRR